MRVLFSTTANDGHFGPLLPFARACEAAGHQVRVAAPQSYADALARVGLGHEPFADVPPEVFGPVLARAPALAFEDADELIIRDVFGRMDAQAALPGLLATMERWRPDVVIRESAEIGCVAAAERAGIPHVHVCIGMHEVATRFAAVFEAPLVELARLADLPEEQLVDSVAAEPVLSLVPAHLDHAAGEVPSCAHDFLRFHEPSAPGGGRDPDRGDAGTPLVYVTFGTVAGSLPPFAGVFRESLDALAELDANVLMTVGRSFDLDAFGAVPDNARVVPWVPQADALAHASAMLGHGGFGTTMGALVAGVPQVVAPLFSFDQVVNGRHVAAVGAGITVDARSVPAAAAEVRRLLEDPAYAERARETAAAIQALPPPSAAVPVLADLAG